MRTSEFVRLSEIELPDWILIPLDVAVRRCRRCNWQGVAFKCVKYERHIRRVIVCEYRDSALSGAQGGDA